MSVEAQVNPRLAALTEAGVSVWLDQIRRGLIEGGELQRLIDECSLRGVTSNPSIFEKAILGSDDYDSELETLAKEGLDAKGIYDRISIRDVQLGADVLRPVHDSLEGADGFVSLEVGPELARDTDGTLAEARRLWEAVDRPNVMIKIPGTAEGVPAIEEAIYEGINVNVTLLFAVEAYVKVAEAFIRGLERRQEEGKDTRRALRGVVLRLARGQRGGQAPRGRRPRRIFRARPRWPTPAPPTSASRRSSAASASPRLAGAGAKVQRPLWASTGVKNPHYPETKYVDELVGAGHGQHDADADAVRRRRALASHRRHTADQDPSAELSALAEAGIDLDDVTAKLLETGIEVVPGRHGRADRGHGVASATPSSPAARPSQAYLPDELEGPIGERVAAAVARAGRPAGVAQGRDALGAGGHARGRGPPRLADHLRADARAGRRPARLRRRGEAPTASPTARCWAWAAPRSAPEVIRRTFGEIEGALRLHVLDSTDPGAVLDLEKRSTSRRRCSSSPPSRAGRPRRSRTSTTSSRRPAAPAASSSPSPTRASPLLKIANENGFRRAFENDPNIGGRYSRAVVLRARSGRADGRVVEGLLEGAQVAEQNCNATSPAGELGAVDGRGAGELALHGPRQAHVRRVRADLELRPLGRAARGREPGQGGQGHPAGGRRAAGRPGRVRRGPRVRLPAQHRRARRRPRREDRGARQGGPSDR